ncbi:M56 family metallopeptidase [Aurantibacillus circumpalustris]|uniref:M56 family metallopeptidase n=1 Tax=Aurantibacillus circumpalustris TaxID=3036359 RepID=UPI00295BDEC5|nr:M56 family metallopeptidase [Aurantibacillus circumpalustris]
MNNFIIYSLEIAISLALFFSAYWLLLKNETFFKLNRFYLVSSVVIALLLPLLNISLAETNGENSFITRYLVLPIEQIEQSLLGNTTSESIPIKNRTTLLKNNLNTLNAESESLLGSTQSMAATSIESSSDSKLNWLSIVLVLYFIGAALFLIRFIANLIWVFTSVLKNKSQQLLGRRIIRIKRNSSPFSFLNFIFISVNEYREDELVKIITHEKIHIQQKHSLDLILFELLLVFQWFNPFAWFYKHAIKITHEYLADEGTLNSGVDVASYQYSLLNQVLSENNLEIASNYNLSIKKRIAMMMKKRTSKLATLKLVITLPLVIFLFSAFAFCTTSPEKDVEQNETNQSVPIGDTTIKRVDVPIEYLKLLEGEYISTNEHGRVRRIIFTELLGTLRGWDNMIEFDHGYSYKIIPVGEEKFINPDDHESLVFDTKDKNDISLLLFGRINLKKVKLEKDKFAHGANAVRLSIAYPLASMMLKEGIPAALSYYKARKDSIYLAEHEMNFAGYDLLQAGKPKEAAAIFKLNSELFPNSFNAYDSYGEALMALGEKTLAIENYKKSVQLNPGSKSGIKVLKEAGINTDDLIKTVKLTTEYLKLLEGDYLSTNQPTWMRWIKFVVEDGVLVGVDNGYRYKLLPMGNGKFINPDDGVPLVFDTKDKNAISLFIFGKTTLKKVKRSEVIDIKKYTGVYLPAKKDTILKPMEIINKEAKLFRFISDAQGANKMVELEAASDKIFFYTDKSFRSIEFILDNNNEVTGCIMRRSDGIFNLSRKK